MNSISAIALSGINAATLRLRGAASNIANARSTGAVGGGAPAAYLPVEVQEAAQVYGCVLAGLVPSRREAVLAYDPQAPFANAQGYVAAPDIDLFGETVQLAMASYEFAANLAVLRTSDEMTRQMIELRV